MNQEKYPGLSKKQRATMTLHGMIIITLGSVAGFAWIIAICGNLHLLPFPSFEIQTVAEQNKELWRNAHLGPIMHAMLVILIAACGSFLKLTAKEAKIMVVAGLTEIWFNLFGFQSAPFTEYRGIEPKGGFIDYFSYGTFYVAVVASFVIITLSIIGSWRVIKEG